MITQNQNNWHYITIKNQSRLFRGITSIHNGDFCCLNCLHSYGTDNALKRHERLCNNHDYCEVKMPTEGKNILKYCSEEKLLHMPHIIYADLEVSFRKFESCQPNLENSYTKKKKFYITLYLQKT